MRDFFVELGRTRVFAEAYKWVRRKRKPRENDAQRKKSHFWMETSEALPPTDPSSVAGHCGGRAGLSPGMAIPLKAISMSLWGGGLIYEGSREL